MIDVKDIVQEVQLSRSTDGQTQFLRVVFVNKTFIDLRGPTSGMKVTETGEGRYDCTFEGYEVVK